MLRPRQAGLLVAYFLLVVCCGCQGGFAFSSMRNSSRAFFTRNNIEPKIANDIRYQLKLNLQSDEETAMLAKQDDEMSPSQQGNEEKYQFDSLDVMLNKARRRKVVMLPYRIQSIANKPVFNIFNKSTLNLGDCVLILVATKLGSMGFCIGYITGKSTTWFLREIDAPIIMVEIWTVALAVGLDVVWNNIF